MNEEWSQLRTDLAHYPDLVYGEVEGLNHEQMCYANEEPPWARWSMDLQIRHIALMTPVWLSMRAGEMLTREGYAFPDTAGLIADLIDSGIRHVPPEAAGDKKAVVDFMRPWAALCCEIIDKESEDRLRALSFTYYMDPEASRPGDPHKPVDYHRMSVRLHPFGFYEDAERPGLFRLEIGGVLRHIYWNVLAHLRTVQRLKLRQGLPLKAELPREGYLTLPEFYDP